MKYIELIYSDIVIRENGTVKNYLAFTDNLGSILSVMDEDGNKVFDASYDAWGRQTVTRNDIGLHRGYTGHEMLNEFDIINMNGRLYDPVLGRFFSPDNYVQLPDYSQSFNRYSYCLNNPLKYTDPSGNLFGIDDAIIAFAVFNMASSIMQASFNGQSVWKAGTLSLLSSAASYGIGSAFGNAGNVGHELLRAGANELASGVVSALGGGNFVCSFVSGAAASGMGSYAQGVNIDPALMVASTTVMGGAVAWIMGGDFLQRSMQGLSIGLFNHAMHDDDPSQYVPLSERTIELDEVVVIGRLLFPRKGFNIGAAVAYLNAHAFATYIKGKCGKCAKAVRLSLEAGGIKTNPHPLSAKDYGSYLRKWGFTEIPTTDYMPIKGDIRVFQNYPSGSPHGHIDMYNGIKWVSDFIEQGDYPGRGYRIHHTPFNIFRW
ncbi:MAG: RHS repeat-associated core domain-containing protein [Hoylesella marshii]|uniref:RHS repeat-associated core domain-containing protein n=1 Tax=Hoylesella marshii TaxID=189722 RepID=UPI003F9F7BFD